MRGTHAEHGAVQGRLHGGQRREEAARVLGAEGHDFHGQREGRAELVTCRLPFHAEIQSRSERTLSDYQPHFHLRTAEQSHPQ